MPPLFLTKNEMKKEIYDYQRSLKSATWLHHLDFYEREKKKGAGKGKKSFYTWEFLPGCNISTYLKELKDVNPRQYALNLIFIEFEDMKNDRWWDTPEYRSKAIKVYKSYINKIKNEYGLSFEDVKEFYNL